LENTMLTTVKPIAICRHEATQGPAYLQTFLDVHEIPYRIFAIDAGDTPPSRAAEFSGIVILGSNASANDGFSWIRREDQLLFWWANAGAGFGCESAAQ
jgi:GMP synthase (glutamine-hydrolysing)